MMKYKMKELRICGDDKHQNLSLARSSALNPAPTTILSNCDICFGRKGICDICNILKFTQYWTI